MTMLCNYPDETDGVVRGFRCVRVCVVLSLSFKLDRGNGDAPFMFAMIHPPDTSRVVDSHLPRAAKKCGRHTFFFFFCPLVW